MPALRSHHALSCSTVSSSLAWGVLGPDPSTATTRKVPGSFTATWDKPSNGSLGEASFHGHSLSSSFSPKSWETLCACPPLATLPLVSSPWCFITPCQPDSSVSRHLPPLAARFSHGIFPEHSPFLSCNHSTVCLHFKHLVHSDYVCSPQPLLYSSHFSSSSLDECWFSSLNQRHRNREITKAKEELEELCGKLSLPIIRGGWKEGGQTQGALEFFIVLIWNTKAA